MLDQNTKAQLKTYLDRLVNPICLEASLDDSPASMQMKSLLEDVASLSPKVRLSEAEDKAGVRTPSFTISAADGKSARIRYACIPMGHEFASFILAMLQTSGYPSKADQALLERMQALKGPLEFDVFISLSCHNCPDVVQALDLLAVMNSQVRVNVIDGALFQNEAKEKRVMAVPTVFLNGERFFSGRRELSEIISKLDEGFVKAQAATISSKPPFDILVIGAGPAGSTAAIYAARKGLRTGVVCERPGGQVNETADIENFTSILKIDGTTLGRDFMRHAASYGVDVMSPERVEKLERSGSLWRAKMHSGAEATAKAVIVCTGARWRELGVPGELEYRGRGVAYCPHCDGPLFKGKDVVVVGGGNSGVEAAIDLAGICRSVTLLQRSSALSADEVLQKRLAGLKNVSVKLLAQVVALEGSDGRLQTVRVFDKAAGREELLNASGCFVQIGLIPNTEWLAGTVELNPGGEIITDSRGATSSEGIFAAGDCTDVPYKQIVIGLGEGAKASLAAFDWLIRQPS